MAHTKTTLAERSHGSFWNAAARLTLAHLLLTPLLVPFWLLGLVVEGWARYPLSAITIAVGFTVMVRTFLRYGVYGAWGRGGVIGESYGESFPWYEALLLGLLRTALQLVMAAGLFAVALATTANLRWWHIVSTPEIDALPDKLASMPLPDSWERVSVSNQDSGRLSTPNQRYDLSYEVPDDYTLADVESWLKDPAWSRGEANAASFGALAQIGCRTETQRCSAIELPDAGRPVEYEISATLSSNSSGKRVRVLVFYEKYDEPRWRVSDDVVDRARSMPFDADWVLLEEEDSVGNGPDEFQMVFAAPEGFTNVDVLAWLKSQEWANTPAGNEFGMLTMYGSNCALSVPAEEGCDASAHTGTYEDDLGIERVRELIEVEFDRAESTITVNYEDH